MQIVVVGLNHQTAPVEIRERFAFSHNELPRALQELKDTKSILECVILATCNRTEIYAIVDRSHMCTHYIPAFIERWFGLPREQFLAQGYMFEGDHAVRHLFRVTCGLDSMIIGETQILGQVRDAFLIAQQQKATGSIANTLFKQAITLGKRVHAETAISEHPVSVSYVAVELGKGIIGSYAQKKVMIVGAGKTSELTLKHLSKLGATQIVVVNRTYARAQKLAEQTQGVACRLEEMEQHLHDVDVMISSTGAHEYMLTYEQLAPYMARRQARPLLILDTAVPRDIDPRIAQLPSVYVYDIDDLESIVEDHLQGRRNEAVLVEQMVEHELKAFTSWLQRVGISPVIQALQAKAKAVHDETMESLLKKLPDLTEREIKIIRKLTKSMVNQMMRDPILRIKELIPQQESPEALQLITSIFAIEDLVDVDVELASNEKANEPRSDDSQEPVQGQSQVDLHPEMKADMPVEMKANIQVDAKKKTRDYKYSHSAEFKGKKVRNPSKRLASHHPTKLVPLDA